MKSLNFKKYFLKTENSLLKVKPYLIDENLKKASKQPKIKKKDVLKLPKDKYGVYQTGEVREHAFR